MTIPPKTAFILQIHNNPHQVNQFIKQLISAGEADVFVHIDKKNYEELKRKILKDPNVKVLEKCVDCEWGDIGQVDATLLLLREVLASRKQYDYICLRSGQDLLVKSGFKSFLLEKKDTIFMNSREINNNDLALMKINWPKITRRRYTTIHPIRLYRRLLISFYGKGINIVPNINYWPNEFSFFKGSQWFSIPFEVANYIIKFIDENEWYYKFFENSLVPDESFFSTLIMNSPYRTKVVNDHLFFIKWGERLSERNSPQILSENDTSLIKGSNSFFARKFDEKIDHSIIHYFVDHVRFGTSV